MNLIKRTKERLWKLRDHLQRTMYLRRVVRENTEFDAKAGTDTAGPEELAKYDISIEERKFAVRYEPVTEAGFRSIIECLVPEPRDYRFVDIGSGKGKALVLAATYPFKEVVGVEFEKRLHDIAKTNIATATENLDLQCANVRSIHADARKFDAYSNNTVLFVFNPFVGPTMEQYVRTLTAKIQQNGHEIILAYLNPTTPEWFDRSDLLHEQIRARRIIIYTTNGVTLDPDSLRRLEKQFSGWA